jgi:hypothetical protein
LRVPAIVLRSIGFVAEVCGPDFAIAESSFVGTAFLVSVPAKTVSTYRHCYIITAKHVLTEKPNTKFVVLVNQKGGGLRPLDLFRWYEHPDPTVDVVVGTFVYETSTEVSTFGLEDAFDDANREPIGVGDEVFFPGLFVEAVGTKQIVPIVRHGNVAMLPNEELQIKGTFAHVYLVEARSMAGISGSPVYVRETIELRAKRDNGKDVLVRGSGEMKLLGLMQGHWDISESELNEPRFRNDPRGVNLGIAIVIPASKILEAIDQPELVKMREEIEEMKRNIGKK